MFLKHCAPLVLLAAFSAVLRAEVVDAGAGGFHLEIRREVSADPAAAWAQFLRVAEWWDGEHSWFGSAANFSLEPRAGGCFCEIDGERQVLHMTVSFVDPGVEMRLLGGLGPLQGMGLHGAMSFRFEPREGGGTTLVHSYRVSGYAKEGLEWLAPVVDSVQTGQLERLQARLNAQP